MADEWPSHLPPRDYLIEQANGYADGLVYAWRLYTEVKDPSDGGDVIDLSATYWALYDPAIMCAALAAAIIKLSKYEPGVPHSSGDPSLQEMLRLLDQIPNATPEDFK